MSVDVLEGTVLQGPWTSSTLPSLVEASRLLEGYVGPRNWLYALIGNDLFASFRQLLRSLLLNIETRP